MRAKRSSLAFINPLVVALVLFFSLLPVAWAKTKFKVLAGVPGGLWSGLTLDSKGNLYGVTGGGGDYGEGSVFELSRNAKGKWVVTTLHSFDGTDGSSPGGNLVFDAAGNLYGTAPDGGTYYTYGTIFVLSPGSGGWSFNVIYNFCSQPPHCPDGGDPNGLIIDGEGNLYGPASYGIYDHGVIYELSPGAGGWTEDVLYSFGSRNYDAAAGPVIFDKAGNLYGAGGGGLYHGGTIFKLTHHPDGWKDRVLYSFCPGGSPCLDGVDPGYAVIFDKSGNIYGTTPSGGTNTCGETHCGTVFKLTYAGKGCWKETVIYDFKPGESGNLPSGGLSFDDKGNLYGTAALGGIGGCTGGCGVVYKLAPGAQGKWKYSVVHEFTGQDGGYPQGGLIFDSKGNLYGTAVTVAFEVTP